MPVYFVHHGQTTWNKRKKIQGQHDTNLSPRGLEQARLTAEGMKDIPFDYIIASPLKRARVNAETLRRDRKLTIEFDDRLKEIDFGKHNGRCKDKFMRDPNHLRYKRFFNEPDRYKPIKGAESLQALINRTINSFEDRIIPLEGKKETVLVVCHTTWIHAFILHVTGSSFMNRTVFSSCL